MADSGFSIRDLLTRRGVKLNILSFSKGICLNLIESIPCKQIDTNNCRLTLNSLLSCLLEPLAFEGHNNIASLCDSFQSKPLPISTTSKFGPLDSLYSWLQF